MTSPIRMDDGGCVLRKSTDCAIKHRIDQLCVWPTANAPCHRHTIIAINHRGQIYLSCWNRELCHIGQPLLVWFVGFEIPLDEIRDFRADFSFVGAVFLFAFAFHSPPIFTHDSPYYLFRQYVTPSVQYHLNSTIPISLFVIMEYRCNSPAIIFVFCRKTDTCSLIVVAALRHFKFFL